MLPWFTRWHEFLRIPLFYVSNVFFALICLIIAYNMYSVELLEKDKKSILMLLSPIVSLLLFKIFDAISLIINKRHFIIVSKYSMLPYEKFNFLDIVLTLSLLVLSIMIPFLLLERGVL